MSGVTRVSLYIVFHKDEDVLKSSDPTTVDENIWHYLLPLLYVIIFMLCAMRILQTFLLFDSLGPKLRMIKDMMQVRRETTKTKTMTMTRT